MDNQIKNDFERDVYCLLGLPVDNMTIKSTKIYLRSNTNRDLPAVWSTINVNWVVQSFRDKEFRKAIINSDLVTLDGKPLLWLSKLLGYPMTEVVPGSTMIQNLHEDTEAKKKLSIFFFGGEGNVGALAMTKVNSQPSGLRAVGAINPGFGTVEEMSSDAIIEEINKAKPDILLVALGAKKGVAWIKFNRDRLNAKVISHLGATINFLAGTVRRAPRLFQVTATEWLWRIFQEPKLFGRYLFDGTYLMLHIVMRVVGWRYFVLSQRKYAQEKGDDMIFRHDHADVVVLSFGRCLKNTKYSFSAQHILSSSVSIKKDIILNFSSTDFIDATYAAFLLILKKHQQKNNKEISIVNVSGRMKRYLKFFSICTVK